MPEASDAIDLDGPREAPSPGADGSCTDPSGPAPAAHPVTPVGLDRLAPGAWAEVAAVEAPGPLGTRLAGLGFCRGTRVHVVRRAPLGDPTLYELRGYQVALRRGEAARIHVRPVGP